MKVYPCYFCGMGQETTYISYVWFMQKAKRILGIFKCTPCFFDGAILWLFQYEKELSFRFSSLAGVKTLKSKKMGYKRKIPHAQGPRVFLCIPQYYPTAMKSRIWHKNSGQKRWDMNEKYLIFTCFFDTEILKTSDKNEKIKPVFSTWDRVWVENTFFIRDSKNARQKRKNKACVFDLRWGVCRKRGNIKTGGFRAFRMSVFSTSPGTTIDLWA